MGKENRRQDVRLEPSNQWKDGFATSRNARRGKMMDLLHSTNCWADEVGRRGDALRHDRKHRYHNDYHRRPEQTVRGHRNRTHVHDKYSCEDQRSCTDSVDTARSRANEKTKDKSQSERHKRKNSELESADSTLCDSQKRYKPSFERPEYHTDGVEKHRNASQPHKRKHHNSNRHDGDSGAVEAGILGSKPEEAAAREITTPVYRQSKTGFCLESDVARYQESGRCTLRFPIFTTNFHVVADIKQSIMESLGEECDFDVSLAGAESEENTGTLVISCAKQNVSDIHHLVKDLLQYSQASIGVGDHTDGVCKMGPMLYCPKKIDPLTTGEAVMEVMEHLVGAVIGEKSIILRQIEKQAGVSIFIPWNDGTASRHGWRRITITGPINNVIQAQKIIEASIIENGDGTDTRLCLRVRIPAHPLGCHQANLEKVLPHSSLNIGGNIVSPHDMIYVPGVSHKTDCLEDTTIYLPQKLNSVDVSMLQTASGASIDFIADSSEKHHGVRYVALAVSGAVRNVDRAIYLLWECVTTNEQHRKFDKFYAVCDCHNCDLQNLVGTGGQNIRTLNRICDVNIQVMHFDNRITTLTVIEKPGWAVARVSIGQEDIHDFVGDDGSQLKFLRKSLGVEIDLDKASSPTEVTVVLQCPVRQTLCQAVDVITEVIENINASADESVS